MLEGILMATPFGLFLYSFYEPFLTITGKSGLTAWMSAFFMPHSVVATTNPFLEFIRWKGPHLFYIGLFGFILFAFQVYWAKFTRKGVVNHFIYAYVRHPQYLFFMISGLGLLFIWPRMMMLALFTIMCVFYYFLAKSEEKRMLFQHPEYEAYMEKTAMFIPGNPGGKLFNLLFSKFRHQRIAVCMTILGVIIIVFTSAVGLRNLTVSSTSKVQMPQKNILAISIYPRDPDYLIDVMNKVLDYEPVRRTLSGLGNAGISAHILPHDYGMLGMFADITDRAGQRERFLKRTSLKQFIWGTESENVKVVFSKISKPNQSFVPVKEIIDMSAKMTPVMVVDLNVDTGKVSHGRKIDTTANGKVPQPIF